MGQKVELKDRLGQAMKLRGMKAVELSEKTGIPQGAISYYLSGRTEPKADRVYLISKVLDISEAWLLRYDVEMERTTAQKKNDKLAQLVTKMRADNEFFSMVSALAELPEEQRSSIKTILMGLGK